MFLNGHSARSICRHFGDQRDDQETDQRCPVLLRSLTAILSSGKGLRPKVCLLAPFYREEMPSVRKHPLQNTKGSVFDAEGKLHFPPGSCA